MMPERISGRRAVGIGTLCYICGIRWWLLITVLAPFALETVLSSRNNYNIYMEMETYWKKERRYTILGEYLRTARPPSKTFWFT